MYKIMLADDEGIIIDSLKLILEKNFKDKCAVEYAYTGRGAIELAEKFKPDIAVMDIHMPGINGIEAMKEIRKANSSVIFIIHTARDKFNYAREAINIGVMEYLTKPAKQEVIVSTFKRAMDIVDAEREKRSRDLMIRERIEIAAPIIERDFIYSALFGSDFERVREDLCNLLDIKEDYGIIFVIELGGQVTGEYLANPPLYNVMRESLKEEFNCIVGPVMVNKVIAFIPLEKSRLEYDDKIKIVEKARRLVRDLAQRLDIQLKAGIGSAVPINRLEDSYREALCAMGSSSGRVAYAKDMPDGSEDEKDYPTEIEMSLYEKIEKGDTEGMMSEANWLFDWMIQNYPEHMTEIKLKVLEFVLLAEKKAVLCAGIKNSFLNRKDYLPVLIQIDNYEQLRKWFIDKIAQACRNIVTKKEEQTGGIISRARAYIEENYHRNISLEAVSKSADISPYYFSKLFKAETGVKFIDYLTGTRIDKAKKLLLNTGRSIKSICVDIGYNDPNYFSRIFKKCVGVTPTEFRKIHK